VKTLDQIRALIIDMDGVLVRGASPLPGISAFFSIMKSRQLDFVVATNNATVSPENLAMRLNNLGVQIPPDQVITSAMATAEYLRDHQLHDGKVLVIGEAPLRQAILSAGLEICEHANEASAVVVGLDREISWDKLSEAAYAIDAGALFIGTNPDPSFPTERGITVGNGAILAALGAATGIQPTIIGKPETHLYQYALRKLGTKPEETLALGDRLDTDILGGIKAGLHTALVLTGVTTRQELENSSIQPDWIFEDLAQLTTQFAAEKK
jgi:4-nitrophenyl phosphatase